MYDQEVIIMSLRDILAKEMAKSGGSAELVKVPANRRPTVASLRKLDREISSQISANDGMRSRSMQRASRMSSR